MVICRRCALPLQRHHRHGFLQEYVLNLIGIYPWLCKDCQITYYRRVRNTAKHDHTRAALEEDQRLKRMVQKLPPLTPRTPRIIDVQQFLNGSK